MKGRTIGVDVAGHMYGAEAMRVTSTSLGVIHHGIFTASLTCEAEGSGIAVAGDYCLDTPVKDADGRHLGRRGTAYGLDYVMRILHTLGVDKWEDVVGQHVLVLYADPSPSYWGWKAVGIAHPLEDRAMIFDAFTKEWLARGEEAVG